MDVWKNKLLSRWAVLCIDSGISTLATILSVGILLIFVDEIFPTQVLLLFILTSILASLLGFFAFKTYSNVIRHSAFTEVARIALATFVKIAVLYSLFLLLADYTSPRILYLGAILDFGFTFFTLSMFRALLILGYRYFVYNIDTDAVRTLIYYDGFSSQSGGAAAFVRERQEKYKILGYISIGGRNSNMRVGNDKVFFVNSEEDFNALRRQLTFSTIIFPSVNLVKDEQERS